MRRRPRSAASRPARRPLRAAHRPEPGSSARLRTARRSACGPTPGPHRHRTAHGARDPPGTPPAGAHTPRTGRRRSPPQRAPARRGHRRGGRGKPSRTTARRATRRMPRSPVTGSARWCTVDTAVATSKDRSSDGRCSAAAATHGAAPTRRCRRAIRGPVHRVTVQASRSRRTAVHRASSVAPPAPTSAPSPLPGVPRRRPAAMGRRLPRPLHVAAPRRPGTRRGSAPRAGRVRVAIGVQRAAMAPAVGADAA